MKNDSKKNNIFQKLLDYFIKYLKIVWSKKIPIIIILIIIIFFISFFKIITSKKLWQTIPTGHVGIAFKKFGGGLSDKIIGEGTILNIPIFNDIYIIDLTRQSQSIDNITADSLEFQDVVLRVNIEFNLQKNNLTRMFREYGIKSISELTEDIISPNLNEVVKNIIIEYPISEVLLNQQELKKEILNEIKIVLSSYYITVYDIDIENILISNAFRKKIAEKELAIQEKDREEILLEQAKFTAERELLLAENRKKIMILEAESIKEFNKQVSNISDKSIKLKEIENTSEAVKKWDGKLPESMGTNNLPFNIK